MRKDKLNRLLDSIYELEGLVHLAISRDDDPAKLPELIVRKSHELNLLAQQTVEADQPEVPSFSDEDDFRDDFDNITSESENYVGAEPSYDPEPAYAADQIPSSEREYLAVAEMPCEPDAPHEPQHIEEQVANPTEEQVEEPVDEHVEDPEDESVNDTADEPVDEPEAIETPPTPHYTAPDYTAPAAHHEEAPVVKPQPVKKETYKFDDFTEPRGRLVFSINDRYRFKRELFKGSDMEFNTTLSLVASMDGYEEAEDYFLNELQWDEKSPDVIDFLEILKNYYK